MAEESKKKLYESYLGKMETLLSSPVVSSIHEAFTKANTKVLRLSRYESSALDTSWISVIEDILYDLGEIIKAPKLVTIEEGNLVPIELAKKIKGESVQHLASHTQYIKDIDEENNVIPSKIMSFGNEDWLYTYENRFIATFIRRLMLFVEKRYEFIENYIPLHKEEAMIIRSKAKIDGAEVEIESKIKVTKISDDPEADAARQAAARIETVRTYLLYYIGSPFMQKMKTERDVRKPILMTNIIRKNPRYHHCYEAFMFIDRYDTLGMDYRSEEFFHPLTDKDGDHLAWLMYSQYLALNDEGNVKEFKSRKKEVRPKVITSIDDEEFVYGRIPSTRLEFVRIDKEYQEYLERKAGKKLPEHPKRQELEFYKDDYAERKWAKLDLKELYKLLSRKQKAAARFELVIEKLIAMREEEERLLREMEEQERLSAEEAILNKKREEIARAAKGTSTSYERKEDELLISGIEAEVPSYTGNPLVVTFHNDATSYLDPLFVKLAEEKEEEKADIVLVDEEKEADLELKAAYAEPEEEEVDEEKEADLELKAAYAEPEEEEVEEEEVEEDNDEESISFEEEYEAEMSRAIQEEEKEKAALRRKQDPYSEDILDEEVVYVDEDELEKLKKENSDRPVREPTSPSTPRGPRRVVVLRHKGRFLRRKGASSASHKPTYSPSELAEKLKGVEPTFIMEELEAAQEENLPESEIQAKPVENAAKPAETEIEENVQPEIPAETPSMEETAEIFEPIEEEPEPEIPAESDSLEAKRAAIMKQAMLEEEPLEEPVEEPIEEISVEEPIQEETPVEAPIEEAPVQESVAEEPALEPAVKPAEKVIEEEDVVEEPEPAPAEEAPVEEKPVEEKPLEETPAEEKPVEESLPVKQPEEASPFIAGPSFIATGGDGSGYSTNTGTFIVKCPEGYYVSDGVFAKTKVGARVFTDFDKALKMKRRYGGKVIKL